MQGLRKRHLLFMEVSFRGEDTRDNFTSHLYKALDDLSIRTFIDYELHRGQEIQTSLMKMIEVSQISIVVFSKGYASSPWCLDELVKILECKNTFGMSVLPIFYYVDPSDVEHQSGIFGDGFKELEEKHEHSMNKWRIALKEATALSGWDWKKHRPDSTLVEVVVKVVSDNMASKMHLMPHANSSGFVGIESSIQQLKSIICIGSNDVRMIGIWGMGGIGKSTCAEVLYHRISNHFEGCCFLANIREMFRKLGSISLLKMMFCQVLKDDRIVIETPNVIPDSIKCRLQKRKVLIVMDDVNDENQLDILVGNDDRFGPGSRVIVTSRDQQVLKSKVDKIFKVQGLCYDDALRLFSLHAFKQKYPLEGFMKLSKRVIDYADGVPLALKVLGSHLCRRPLDEWSIVLDKLKQFPDSKIQKILQISYEELDDMVKDIFLDIACFFRSWSKNRVENMLRNCGFEPSWGIMRLVDKCLINIVHPDVLDMHDLIQDMGRHIARRNGSRLWNSEDIYQMLTANMGNKKVEALFLDMSKVSKVCFDSAAFSRMPNLRMLRFYNRPQWQVNVLSKEPSLVLEFFYSNSLRYLPCKLMLLHWEEFPYCSLPSKFSMRNLVELYMPRSHIKQLWDGDKCPYNLKRLDLSESLQLVKLINLSWATKLERIQLRGCKSLVEIHSSIQHLHNLAYLDLKRCKNLKMLPVIPRGIEDLILDESGLEEWPDSFLYMDNLDFLSMKDCKNIATLPTIKTHTSCVGYDSGESYLDLSGCLNLQKLPEITGNIKYLDLSKTAIEDLPSSISCLSLLVELKMKNCQNLKTLSESISQLKQLEILVLTGCSKLEKLPPSLDGLSSIRRLYLDEAGLVEISGTVVCLSSLRELSLANCIKLQRLPDVINGRKYTAPTLTEWVAYQFNYCNCINLDEDARCNIMADTELRIKGIANAAKNRNMRNNTSLCSFIVGLPGSEIPEWFIYQRQGYSLAIQLPPDCFNTTFLGFAFCVILNSDNPGSFTIKCHFKREIGEHFTDFHGIFESKNGFLESDHVFLLYIEDYSGINDWLIENGSDIKKAAFEFKPRQKVKKFGVHLIYDNVQSNQLSHPQEKPENTPKSGQS